MTTLYLTRLTAKGEFTNTEFPFQFMYATLGEAEQATTMWKRGGYTVTLMRVGIVKRVPEGQTSMGLRDFLAGVYNRRADLFETEIIRIVPAVQRPKIEHVKLALDSINEMLGWMA